MDKEDSRKCYEQYWTHARHLETELLAFCSFYAVIIGASLIFIKSDLKRENIYVFIFILILSTFGFFFYYNLRIPFIKFILKAELIAIKEFGLPREYRRFFDTRGNLFNDKFIDTYDIFALLFISVITFTAYITSISIYALTISIPFLLLHIYHRRKLAKIKHSIQNDLYS